MKGNSEQPLDKARKEYNSYLRFTGLGFTMVGVILASTFAGWWLDGLIGWKYPALTVLLSLLGIAGAMIYLFKETGKR